MNYKNFSAAVASVKEATVPEVTMAMDWAYKKAKGDVIENKVSFSDVVSIVKDEMTFGPLKDAALISVFAAGTGQCLFGDADGWTLFFFPPHHKNFWRVIEVMARMGTENESAVGRFYFPIRVKGYTSRDEDSSFETRLKWRVDDILSGKPPQGEKILEANCCEYNGFLELIGG